MNCLRCKGGYSMRHVLVGVMILGAALGLAGETALACGDHLECTQPTPTGQGPVLVETQPAQATGAPAGQTWWFQMRGENREH